MKKLKKEVLKGEISEVKWDEKKGLYTAYWALYNKKGEAVMTGEMDFDYERDDNMSYELAIFNEVMEVLKSEGKDKN